jgi:hypothetical protein
MSHLDGPGRFVGESSEHSAPTSVPIAHESIGDVSQLAPETIRTPRHPVLDLSRMQPAGEQMNAWLG